VKTISCILLASVILSQSLSSLVVIAGYEINKGYIIRAFCENKDIPTMHCDGKCHLRKQLDEEKRKDQSPSSLKDKKEITQFSEAISEYCFDGNNKLSNMLPQDCAIPPQEFHALIFHPPAA